MISYGDDEVFREIISGESKLVMKYDVAWNEKRLILYCIIDLK
jgi:hypothetical protein